MHRVMQGWSHVTALTWSHGLQVVQLLKMYHLADAGIGPGDHHHMMPAREVAHIAGNRLVWLANYGNVFS